MDRGIALVSMAVAIVLGATSMSDITLLAHHAAVLGAEPSDTTVRRTLELADPPTLDRIGQVRARVRAHVWSLIAATPAGFPWLSVAGKLLAGWLVVDLDATLITAHRPGRGRSHVQEGLRLPSIGGVAGQYNRKPGDAAAAGQRRSTTFADHLAVLTAAIRQIPSRMRSRLLVRVDEAGASRCCRCRPGAGPRCSPAAGSSPRLMSRRSGCCPRQWQAAVDQDGAAQEDKHITEITHLLSRAADWPDGLRWIVRRTKPSRRQMKNLTAFECATGWRYSIIVTNIPAAAGIPGVPGSHHAQFIDVLHREHAIAEVQVRTNKAMGLRNLQSKTWQVNCGWVIAANIAADLTAWCRLLGLYDQEDLKDAEPDTLRPIN